MITADEARALERRDYTLEEIEEGIRDTAKNSAGRARRGYVEKYMPEEVVAALRKNGFEVRLNNQNKTYSIHW